MSKPIDEIKNRLTTALSIRNMRPIELSEITKIPKSTISQYMSGYAKPKTDRLYLISQALHINETWLLGYDVPMERGQTAPEAPELSPADKQIIDRFLQLDNIDKAKISERIDILLENEKYIKDTELKEDTAI